MRSNTRYRVRLHNLPEPDLDNLIVELSDLHRRLDVVTHCLDEPQLRAAHANVSITLDRAEALLRELRSTRLARSGSLD